MAASSALTKADVCVLGAGSAGLSVAAGAAQLGQKVVLIEKGEMGGDCLNYGCVPSKALIAAAKHAHAMRTGAAFGVAPAEPQVDFAQVKAHVRGVIDAIAPIDSQERFEGLGVDVIRAPGRFTDARTVEAGGRRVTARYFVVATGSTPATPPIPGLDTVPYLTNETLFDLDQAPGSLLIIGGGPIGVEMAQAHRRLGADVTVIEAGAALGRDDPELAAVATGRLRSEGVRIIENARVVLLARVGSGDEVEATVEGADGRRTLRARKLLVAAGRRPTVEGLNLEAAGVEHSARGISVDRRLRTANKRIYAIGDVAGGRQFTHVAGYHASVFIRNALFKLPTPNREDLAPWVTYTDPELAQVGLTEAQARAKHGDKVRVARWELAENDRAQAERDTAGFIKAVIDKSGRILGASIVGAHAGELINPWVLALSQNMKLTAFSGYVAPYPTRGEISKRVAGAHYGPKLFSPGVRMLLRALSVFG